MTNWSQCRCTRTHTTGRGFIRCKLKAVRWITGNGPYALISWCRTPTVTLWATRTEALDRASILDASGCATECRASHQIIHIQLDRKAI